MGRDKSTLDFEGEPLLARAVRQVSASGVGAVVIVAAACQTLPRLGVPAIVARDEIEGQGPLRGLASGLAVVPDHQEYLYLTATDAPYLAAGFIAFLRERIGASDVAIPRVNGRMYPLSAVYRIAALRPAIDARLSLFDAKKRGLVSLVEDLCVRTIDEVELRTVDPDLVTLLDIDTPEEYERRRSRIDAINQ